MRKITESTFVSLDGVADDPRAWAMSYFDEDAQREAREALEASDGMLMGRGTYEYLSGMAEVTGPYADAINTIPKYVFTDTLQRTDWNNSTIVPGDAISAITELKQQDGRGLIIYGHGRFAQAVLDHGLLDELRLAVHPVLRGCGPRLTDDTQPQELRLLDATALRSGVVVLTYQPSAAHGG